MNYSGDSFLQVSLVKTEHGTNSEGWRSIKILRLVKVAGQAVGGDSMLLHIAKVFLTLLQLTACNLLNIAYGANLIRCSHPPPRLFILIFLIQFAID